MQTTAKINCKQDGREVKGAPAKGKISQDKLQRVNTSPVAKPEKDW